jgi:preprotein translocase subunit SecE
MWWKKKKDKDVLDHEFFPSQEKYKRDPIVVIVAILVVIIFVFLLSMLFKNLL